MYAENLMIKSARNAIGPVTIPGSEVRPSVTLHDAFVYPSTRPDLGIRIHHQYRR